MIKAKFTKGQTINYKSGQFVASGEVVNIEEKMHFGKKQVIYIVSEGNGGQNMTEVPESHVMTLLNE
tara:strand:- start:3364 stop:3564 length:201 start_codon:yes stop_codon:yes gene_type:complete